MSNKFNLFILQRNYDKHPRSWICVSGENIKQTIYELEKKIENKYNINREELSRVISKDLSCSLGVIKQLFQGKKNFYPIPVILKICNMYKRKNYIRKIYSEITSLKLNSASAKPVKALKMLNKELAKIIGAFMADGNMSYQITIPIKTKENLTNVKKELNGLKIKFTEGYSKSRKEYFVSFFLNKTNIEKMNKLSNKFNLQTHPKLEITDEHKSNVEAFNKWIYSCFGLNPTSFNKKKNAWRSVFANKIICRYLMSFFGIIPGPKTTIAFEPDIIKSSNLQTRKEFAKGVLMFDGSVSISGIITFSSKSKTLFNSISDIFTEYKINFGTKRDRYLFAIFTYRNNNLKKLLNLFEKNTIKWLRLKESHMKSEDLKFETRYKEYSQNKVTFKKLIKLLNEIKICDINFLAKYFNCRHITITHYLNILKNNGRIKLSKKPMKINHNFVCPKTTVFLKINLHDKIFKDIKKKFINYQEFGKYMNIHKATLSSWKLRKNRIPLYVAENICYVLDINSSLIYENIKETDRRIVVVV